MADKNKRALVIFERIDQGVDRRNVEVGRRLVHQEEVGRIDEQAREGEAGFFSTGEDRNFFMHVILAEEKAAEHGTGLLLGELVLVGAELHHIFKYGEVQLKIVGAILREITRHHVAPEVNFAALDRDDTRENL